MGRIGSCMPRHTMLALLAPHCWKATSFADPEYVMDLTSPSAFWALAITAFASCAPAFPATNARPMAITASFLIAVLPVTDADCTRGGVRWESVRDASSVHPGRPFVQCPGWSRRL